MLPTLAAVAVQTVDQYQPQIFSLLPSSNGSDPVKKPRRRKLARSDDLIPVMINPQITKTSRGTTLPMPQSIPSSAGTSVIEDQHLLSKLRVDTNNNINNHHIPSSIGLPSSSILSQMQQTSIYLSEVADTNSNPSSSSRSQTFGGNQLFTNNLVERNLSIPSRRENEPNYLQPSFTVNNQGSLFSQSSLIPSSLLPISISEAPPRKPTRRYARRSNLTMSVREQQQQPHLSERTSPYSLNLTQSSISDGLPTIIPASVRTTSSRSEETSLPSNMPIPASVMAFTPNGTDAPVHEQLPLASVRQHLLPFTTSTVSNINLMPKQYLAAHRFPFFRRTIDDTSVSRLPFQYNTFIADSYGSYCMVPSSFIPTTILPVPCSSTLPETVADQPSIPNTNDAKKETTKLENNSRRSRLGRKSIVRMLRNERYFNTKTRALDFSASQKRKHKSSKGTRKQLRYFSEQNRLAVLKFMMRKQKQQKQPPSLVSRSSETKIEEEKSELASTSQIQQQDTKRSLPDIIAPNLKISFGATQKIESIALSYHRRRQANVDNANLSKPSIGDDNRLSLLLEAVELLETLEGNSKIMSSSNT